MKNLNATSPHEYTTPDYRDYNELVTTAREHYRQEWWNAASTLPVLGRKFTRQEKLAKERALDQFLTQLNCDLRTVPPTEDQRLLWREKLITQIKDFVLNLLEWPEECINILFHPGFQTLTSEFVGNAKEFNSSIEACDVYQAIRNTWIANSIQILLGDKLQLTPSIFGYSMLYPYTDNYLDNPELSQAAKIAFNERFEKCLAGWEVQAANTLEQAIFDLVGIIETQYPRTMFPGVYQALLGIHHGQSKSLIQQTGTFSPYENDILGISIEKGGTSVLADGYLIRGTLTKELAYFTFGYGVFLQLIDDLQDVHEDMTLGHMTVFSQTATRWSLDGVTNRLFNFMSNVLNSVHFPESPVEDAIKGLIWHSCVMRIVEDVAKERKFFSKKYVAAVEEYSHFHFAYLKRLKRRIERRYSDLNNLVYVLPGCQALPFASIKPRDRTQMMRHT